MTSMPASRRARAMIFAPRSWPSSPGLATTTRILREVSGAMGRPHSRRNAARRRGGGAGGPPHARRSLDLEDHLLVGGTVDRADDRVGARLRDLLRERPRG